MAESYRIRHQRQVKARVAVALADYPLRFDGQPSWSDLGDLLGWGQSTRSDVTRGERPIQLHELILIAARLAVSLEWLPTGDAVIEAAQAATGFSQVRLAHALGVNPSTLRRWLSGARRMAPTAERLCEAIVRDPTIAGR